MQSCHCLCYSTSLTTVRDSKIVIRPSEQYRRYYVAEFPLMY